MLQVPPVTRTRHNCDRRIFYYRKSGRRGCLSGSKAEPLEDSLIFIADWAGRDESGVFVENLPCSTLLTLHLHESP